MTFTPLQTLSCEDTLWHMLEDVATDGASPLDAFICPYTTASAGGLDLGLTGVGLLVVGGIYLSMRHWTEGELMPTVWLVLTGSVVFSWIPASFLGPLAGIVTAAVTMLFVGGMLWLRRVR